jgi:hypothetical protein
MTNPLMASPPEDELALKLEGIFMPHARKQRDELYGSDPDPRFVHYTSAENALSIIRTKRLWMRSTVCMNDYREVQHGWDILAKFFKENIERFCSAVDAVAPGAAKEAIRRFDGWWEPGIRFHTYVASVSEHLRKEDFHGRLSMWRAFGNNATRVGIVFRVPSLSQVPDMLNIIFSPAAYLTEDEAHAVINDVIKNIELQADLLRTLPGDTVMQYLFTMLRAAATCLKHDGFGEEREWRAIYSPKLQASKLMETATEVIGGVPQIVHKIPLDASVDPVLADLDFACTFDRLIIGPSPFPLPIADAFADALGKAGIKDAANRVFASRIPIRF